MQFRPPHCLPYLLIAAMAGILFAQQPGIGNEFDRVVDYYSSAGLDDAVTRLQRSLASGQTKLEFEPAHGYLISVLKQLKVPVDSQVLVWSKTSSQADHTSPQTPRAIYFNDDVYVGWAPGDDQLDLIAIDRIKGPIFFTLSQRPGPPAFERDSRCMNCHFNNKTLSVPGLIVRSVLAKPDGSAMIQASTFVAGHNNPLSQRWGGWYVTGTHSQDTHMGNAFLYGQDPAHLNLQPTSNLTGLSALFDARPYLSPHSDSVALLVLDDVVRMENMITRARFQALHSLHDPPLKNQPADDRQKLIADRQKLIANAAEPLLTYMLYRDEAPLHGPIAGTSDFATRFSQQGPFDSKGRSLREFDLKTRLFKYPCSYRIYSPGFDAMPDPMKNYIWKRLNQTLTGPAREILLETKPEFKSWIEANTRPPSTPK